MAQFPRDEVGIIDLGRKFVGGLNAGAMNFASLPISKSEFEIMMAEYNSLMAEIKKMEAQLSQKIAGKNKVLGKITSGLKRNFHFLESITNGSDTELQKYGWGGRRKRQKITPPEQPRYLEVIEQGPEHLVLDWKVPAGGGKVRLYKIYRRLGGESDWQEINGAMQTKIKLLGQPRKVNLEFYVTAINNAGESLPSDIVKVVL